MAILPHDFHFLRPLWFLALAPALALFAALRWSRLRGSGWARAINRALLPHLLDATPGGRRRLPLILLLAAWLLATAGLAGPAWQRLPQPVRQKEDGLVIIQDLSLSFYAQDLSPDRLTRARHKLTDLLKSRREGLTALIVYAGDAHVVSPLTDDTNTIEAMVEDLDPGIMPSYGSNPASAVKLALKLCLDSGLNRGRLLLLTDEVTDDQATKVTDLLRGQNFTLSVLGIGTADGAPIPTNDGGFLKDERGRIVIPRLDRAALARLAATNGGGYRDIRIDDSDFQDLLASGNAMPRQDEYRQTRRRFDQWQDQGYWLAVLLVPLALLAFRRGWLLAGFFLFFTLLPATSSYALGWRDLWLRPDQQAARALAANHPEEAASLFKSQPWRGAAQYRAGNFEQAAAAFDRVDNANDNYNRGNALARSGRLQEALQSYDRALGLDPGMTDARDNRELVEKLLRQQKRQEQSQKSEDQGQQGPQGHQEGQQGQKGREGEQGKNQKSEGDRQKDQQGLQDQKRNQSDQTARPGQDRREQADNKAGSREQQKEMREEANKAQQARAGDKDLGGSKKDQAVNTNPEDDKLSPEQRQALAQWLRQIPDDPGGLLRRKFQYQYQRNQAHGDKGGGKIW